MVLVSWFLIQVLPIKSMQRFHVFLLSLFLVSLHFAGIAQDSASFKWTVTSKKIADRKYELRFTGAVNSDWELYAPDQ